VKESREMDRRKTSGGGGRRYVCFKVGDKEHI